MELTLWVDVAVAVVVAVDVEARARSLPLARLEAELTWSLSRFFAASAVLAQNFIHEANASCHYVVANVCFWKCEDTGQV